MNKKRALFIGLGVASAVAAMTAIAVQASAEDYASEALKKDLEKSNDIYKGAKKQLSDEAALGGKATAILENEARQVKEKLDDWKTNHEYDSKIKAIKVKASETLDGYREAIGYSENMRKIDSDKDAAIEKVKETLKFDEKVAEQNKLIKEAKDVFTASTMFLPNNSAAEATKKAAASARDAAVKEANEKIEALNKNLKKESKAIVKDAEAKKEDLNELVRKKQVELSQVVDDESAPLVQELALAKARLTDEVVKARSMEDNDLISSSVGSSDRVKAAEALMSDIYKDELGKLTPDDALVLYLKDKNVHPAAVVTVGALTGLPILYFGYKYVKGLVGIVARL